MAIGLWDLPMSLPTLPAWGCLRDGELFEQPKPERPTGGSESLLLPTPTMQDGENTAGPSQLNRNSLPLNTLVTLLPTPTVMDMGSNYTPEEWQVWKAQQRAAHRNGNGHGASLTQEAISLLPTPTAQAAKHGETPDLTANSFGHNLWDLPHLLPTPKAGDGERGRDLPRLREDEKSRELATAVAHLLPTPTATDVGKHAGQPRHKRIGHQARIADVIEYLPEWNGVNTARPSADGSASADDPRQSQLFPAPTAGHA